MQQKRVVILLYQKVHLVIYLCALFPTCLYIKTYSKTYYMLIHIKTVPKYRPHIYTKRAVFCLLLWFFSYVPPHQSKKFEFLFQLFSPPLNIYFFHLLILEWEDSNLFRFKYNRGPSICTYVYTYMSSV